MDRFNSPIRKLNKRAPASQFHSVSVNEIKMELSGMKHSENSAIQVRMNLNVLNEHFVRMK